AASADVHRRAKRGWASLMGRTLRSWVERFAHGSNASLMGRTLRSWVERFAHGGRTLRSWWSNASLMVERASLKHGVEEMAVQAVGKLGPLVATQPGGPAYPNCQPCCQWLRPIGLGRAC